MLLVLKEFDRNGTVQVEVAFEPSKDGYGDSHFALGPRGLFCELGNDRLGLFVVGDRLLLYSNGIAVDVRERRVTALSRSEVVIRRLTLTIDGLATDIRYDNPRKPISTLFYSEDDEDADFGLWLSNVLASENRRDVFLGSWRANG